MRLCGETWIGAMSPEAALQAPAATAAAAAVTLELRP